MDSASAAAASSAAADASAEAAAVPCASAMKRCQGGERGSKTASSEPPVESSASRKSSSRVDPLRPPCTKT
jgi:hypothetical protein